MKRTFRLSLFRAKTDVVVRFRRARLEQLERRDLLSVTAGGIAFSESVPDPELAYIAPTEPTGAVQLDAQGLCVSRHCVREEVYREHNIIDISRSGFSQTSVSIFTASLQRMGGTYVLDEASDNCLHLEF